MQLLDDTPAVLSLGKLCEANGNTYEWASGQKSHLTKQGKKILCKTENFLHFVVLGLSSKFWCQLVFYIATAGLIKYIFKSSNRATCRWGTRKLARYTKNPTKRKKGTTDGASGNRLRDIPDWLQEFTENLEDTEVPAPAHMSPDSDSERPTKVASRKHRIYTHLPKDRNCEVCLRTKITRTPCRRRTGEAVPRAKKFCDLMTADHKVLNEDGESRNNSRYVVVVQDLVTQRIQSYLCKTETSQLSEKFQESFSSRQKLTLTILWNLANNVQIYHGIIGLQHHIDPRRMGLPKEQYEE